LVYLILVLCLIVFPSITVRIAGGNRKWWYIDSVLATLSAAVSATVVAGPWMGIALSAGTGFVVIAAARVSALKCTGCGEYAPQHRSGCPYVKQAGTAASSAGSLTPPIQSSIV
jgi:hypothetical protein